MIRGKIFYSQIKGAQKRKEKKNRLNAFSLLLTLNEHCQRYEQLKSFYRIKRREEGGTAALITFLRFTFQLFEITKKKYETIKEAVKSLEYGLEDEGNNNISKE